MHIVSQRMPQSEEFHVVGFDKADASKIVQFLLVEGQSAEMIYLCIDLIEHFLGEYYAFVTAFEMIFSVKVGMLVEDNLVHVEFIKVGIKKALDDGFEFHGSPSGLQSPYI